MVGGGYGGLSVAALLAKKGFRVTVLEKNDRLGGRAMVQKSKGFLFDRGPSWYLMPEVFERFFARFGKKPSDFYKLVRLDPSYRVFYHDKTRVDIPASRERTVRLFDRLEPDGGKKLERYLAEAKYKYDTAMASFLYRDYASILDFLQPRLVMAGLRLHLFESIDAYARRFFRSDKARKILEYAMVFLGGSPDNTPALYSLMSHVDLTGGVWYPPGGMGELTRALQKLGKGLGVEYLTGQDVRKILVEKGRTVGVRTDKKDWPADIVVVSSDYPHAQMELLDDKHQSYPASHWEGVVMAPSALLFYIGLKKRLKSITHHNLFLAGDWRKHFDSIFKRPGWPDDPSYYVKCTSKDDPKAAPRGCENLFFLVPVAPGLDDTDEVRERYFEKVLAHFESSIGERVRDHVVFKEIASHRDFKRLYHAYQGTALGLAHTLWQTAVFRPPHQDRKVRNLFYTGNYTHPGIGVPMVVIASEITSEEVDAYERTAHA